MVVILAKFWSQKWPFFAHNDRSDSIDRTASLWKANYLFDDAYRLQTYTPTPPTRTYAPPPASMTYDDDNRLETYNGQTVLSDLDGNLRAAPLNGTLLGTLNWDARNRLVGTESSIQNSTSIISFSYDAENRRVTSTSPAGTTRYTWSREAPLDRLLVKENPDGSVTRYIHGLGLIYEETEPAGGGPVSTQYYHYNWQGSTMALSDQAGAITARLSYSPYGEVTIVSGTPNTPFLFNGQFGVMTESNGLYSMQARFYSPIFRRFLSEDPAGFSGGINLFAYTGGDPVNFMDPFGLGPTHVVLQGFRSVFNASLDLIGKAWNLPNTVIGLGFGSVGLLGGATISFGNNAIQFENHPLMSGAITLGNTISYAPGFGADIIGDHERQHTYQGQTLGLLYLPSNALGLALAQLINGDTHGPLNWNERGPQSNPPTPW